MEESTKELALIRLVNFLEQLYLQFLLSLHLTCFIP